MWRHRDVCDPKIHLACVNSMKSTSQPLQCRHDLYPVDLSRSSPLSGPIFLKHCSKLLWPDSRLSCSSLLRLPCKSSGLRSSARPWPSSLFLGLSSLLNTSGVKRQESLHHSDPSSVRNRMLSTSPGTLRHQCPSPSGINIIHLLIWYLPHATSPLGSQRATMHPLLHSRHTLESNKVLSNPWIQRVWIWWHVTDGLIHFAASWPVFFIPKSLTTHFNAGTTTTISLKSWVTRRNTKTRCNPDSRASALAFTNIFTDNTFCFSTRFPTEGCLSNLMER